MKNKKDKRRTAAAKAATIERKNRRAAKAATIERKNRRAAKRRLCYGVA